MKTFLNFCMAMAVMLSLGSCAVTDIDKSADFRQYKTFGFGTAEVNVNSPAYKGSLISSKIRRNVQSEFEKHGLVFDKTNPDLLVSYETFTADKEKMYSTGYPNMMYPGMFYRGLPMMWGYPYGGYGGYGGSYKYTEGTLIIDVVDAKTNEEVWRGLVKGDVSNLNSLSRSIDKGVRAIMRKYPSDSRS